VSSRGGSFDGRSGKTARIRVLSPGAFKANWKQCPMEVDEPTFAFFEATVTAVDYLTRGTGSDAARGLRQGGPSTGLHVGGQRGRQKPRGK